MARQNHSRQSKNRTSANRARTGRQPTSRTPASRAPSTADGRSRSARNAGKRRIQRKRRSELRFKLFCGLLICIVIVMAPTVFFRVSKVEVSGETRYAQSDLIETSGVREGDNMFFLDSGHIAQKLYDEYPYLGNVTLHRSFPSTLQIEVSERTPVLSVESGDRYFLMDMSGKLMDKTAAEAPDTVVVTGVDTSKLKVGDTIDEAQEKLMTVIDLMEMMTEYELNTKMRGIDIEKAYDVRVQYADQYTILFGNLDGLEHKIQFLQAILREPSLPESGVIDLTDDKEARYRPALESDDEDEADTDDAENDATSEENNSDENTSDENAADGDAAQEGTETQPADSSGQTQTDSNTGADANGEQAAPAEQTDGAQQQADSGQAET